MRSERRAFWGGRHPGYDDADRAKLAIAATALRYRDNSNKKLFQLAEPMPRRWNNDHEAHLDWAASQ